MKRILQKSYAWLVMLVAMFAVSSGAWAQEADVTILFTDDGRVWTQETGNYWANNGITAYVGDWRDTYANVTKNPGEDIRIVSDDLDIAKVVFNGGQNLVVNEVELEGDTWTGSATVIEVSSSEFDGTNISGIQVWYASADLGEAVDYTVNAPDGVSVTIFGNAVENGKYNTDQRIKTSDVAVASVPSGYKVEVTVDNINYIVTVTLHELILAHMTGVSPVAGDFSLDEHESGLSYITVTMDTYLAASFNFSGSNIPDGFTITDENGTAYSFSAYGNGPSTSWWGTTKYNNFSINLSESIKTPGTYTLHIPAGVIEAFEEDKANEEITLIFTVTAKTKFRFSSYNVEPSGNGSYTEIESIVLPIPSEATFEDGTQTVTIEVNDNEVNVDATINATKRTITLDWQPAGVGYYTIVVPEASFVDANGLKNEELWLGYEIIPTLAADERAADGEGNYWTTFALAHNYTLPTGCTPYKVVAVGETGTLSLEEIVGTPKTDDVEVYFNGIKSETYIDIRNTTFTALDGKVSVERSTNVNLCSRDEGGYYLEAQGSPVVYTVTVLDETLDIADIKLLGWNSNYVENSTMSKSGNVITVTSEGIWTNVGGIRFGLATGEFNAPILPANAGILVKTTEAGNMTYSSTYNSPTANMTDNLLVGCTADATWNEDGKRYYKFSLDAHGTAGSAGFYWGVDGGASIEAHAGKAYLVLGNDAASNSRFLINGFGEETGIEAVATESNDVIYNLQGQRVNATKAGIYVKNGKKFIVK